MESTPIIVDTNIIFSALLNTNSRFATILLYPEYQFYVGESVLVELFKHQQKIIKLSQLSEDDLVRFYHILLRRVNLYKEDLIQVENLRLAYSLCHDIDVNDTLHVALTLELKGKLWTGDNKLKQGLNNKSFDSFFDPNL